jgi:hypothetical protein
MEVHSFGDLLYLIAFGIVNTQGALFVMVRIGYLELMSLPRGLRHRGSTE